MMYVLDDVVVVLQAEDGIRDRNVTGVQTCALPISPGRWRPRGAPPCRRSSRATPPSCSPWPPCCWRPCPAPAGSVWPLPRSEERRVGEECRARGGAEEEEIEEGGRDTGRQRWDGLE